MAAKKKTQLEQALEDIASVQGIAEQVNDVQSTRAELAGAITEILDALADYEVEEEGEEEDGDEGDDE